MTIVSLLRATERRCLNFLTLSKTPSWSEQYVYERRATEKLADDEEAETLFVALAEFEERCKEPERARFIYKFAFDHIPTGRYGDKEGIEDAIAGNRRFQYEDEVRKNPLNYDSWINYALYKEIKTEDVERTRDIFKNYIEIELQLGNIDRCRKLYELYLEWSPENCYAWSKYAELERSLDETELARTTFELAISQPALDMP
ncbi:unnamed protein product [Brassica rapa subsp. trilocularis]